MLKKRNTSVHIYNEAEIDEMIGTKIEKNQILKILKSLGIDVNMENELITATIPTFRHDISNSHDICEEIVRIIGIDNIASKPLVFAENCRFNETFFDYENAKILGIDYAMQGMAVFSEGIELEKAGFFRRNEKRLAREQRKLSRCVKESRNYVRQKKKVARCHEKIRNQRKDYLHKLSRRITDQYDIVAVEDIDMKAMGQCLHFGKSVQDNGYGMFRNMLDYKLAWKGKKLVKIDRFFPSSKKCSKCGKIKKELGLSERVYRCTCGNEMDRDRNAAINIREEARRMLAV